MTDLNTNLQGFIPEEFEKECRALGVPYGVVFRYDFISRLPDLSRVKIAYLGTELDVPKYLFPYSIECFERRQDRERAKARRRELVEKQAKVARERELREERRRSLQSEFPKMFPR